MRHCPCGAHAVAGAEKDAPAIAFLLVLTAGVILLLRVFSAAGSAAQRFSGLLSQCGLDSALYLPVCKAVGVAVVVRITAALCRDAGQSALAAKMEIAGAVLTLSISACRFSSRCSTLLRSGRYEQNANWR